MNKIENIDFKHLYIVNYPKLKRFAIEYILSEDEAEDIVQDVFLALWDKKEALDMPVNIIAFLFTATRNRCLDYLRHQNVIKKNFANLHEQQRSVIAINTLALEEFDQSILEEDIEDILSRAINSLPEKCKEIFTKVRLEGKKHKEVAETLNISTHTIEAQMNIAYKKLRVQLRKYIPLLLFLV